MSTDTHKSGRDVPIAIVGMACLFPKAEGLSGYWRVLRSGRDCIDDVPSTHWSVDAWFDADPKSPDRTYCRRGGFLEPVRFDPTEFQMPPNAIEATDTSQILGLVVAKAALDDAGYGEGRTFDREKTSVILGVTGCLELVIPLGARLGHPIWRQALAASGVSDDVAEQVVERISSAYVPWQENSFPGLLGNVVAGRIANRLDLHGTNCVVDAACASSNSAAHLATLELAAGRADMVVTGGVDTFNDIFMYMCFSKTPALSPSGECRPFSELGDGTLLGEGIGMVVLKRLSDAERDGDRVYAVIRGIGTSSDGEGQAIYAPSSDGQKRCLERAYENAGVDPATIGLVEAHGTGTKVGDVVEFEALRSVFSGHRDDHGWCALGSVKSQIGHTKAAAGAAGLIKAALALHHKVLPPTLKADRPNPKLRLEHSPFYLSDVARPWLAQDAHPRRAALSAFGFGGSNFHIVLEEHGAQRTAPAWDGSVQIVALAADTIDALRTSLDAFEATLAADASGPALARAAWESRQLFSVAHRHRLVVVVSDGAALEGLRRARTALDGGSAGPDVFIGEGDAPGRVAFLFPGQGSQYVDMGRDLACVFPEMLDALVLADAADEEGARVSAFIHPIPARTDSARADQLAALTRTDRAQPALGAVETGMLGVLRRFGLSADLTCGHSYGELVALHAAGVIDAPTLHRLSLARGRAMARLDGDRGTMAAVAAPLADVEALIDACGLEVRLANRNAPRQAIVSGSRAAVETASAACREQGWTVRPLQVSAAFHSALVADARAPFRAALEAAPLHEGRFPVFANHGGGPYPREAAASRDLLADQLVSAVDFIGMIENIYAAGARVFVEVGPRATLSGLVREILGDRSHLRCAVDASAGRDGGVLDLARVLARCAAAGVPVDLGAWETTPAPVRKKRMEVTLVGANYRAPNRNGADSVPRPPSLNGSTVHAPVADASAVSAFPPAPAPIPPPPAAPTRVAAHASPAPPLPQVRPSVAPTGGAAVIEGGLFVEAFRSVQSNIQALQGLQHETAAAHQRFLEGQEQAMRTFQQVLDGQQRLVDRMLGGATVAHAAVPTVVHAPLPTASASTVTAPLAASPLAAAPPPTVAWTPPAAPVPAVPVPVVGASPAGVAHVAPVPPFAPPAVAISTAPAPTVAAPSATRLEAQLLSLVADKTGYPVELLHLDMDLESDLGIDSIKRVEILAGMEERTPEAGRIPTDKMGSLRTLRQVIELLVSALPPVPAPSTSVGASAPLPHAPAPPRNGAVTNGVSDRAATLLLEVIADKTGYPREMLDLDMDLESDLGIDSIKRVEILAAMEERLPEAGRVETDRMGSLRTLRQVLEALLPQPPSGPSGGGGGAPRNGHAPAGVPPSNGHATGAVSGNGNGSVASRTPLPPTVRPNGSHGAAVASNGNGHAPASRNGASHAAPAPGAALLQRQLLRLVDAPAATSPAPLRLAPEHELRVVDEGQGLAAAIVSCAQAQGVEARLVTFESAGADGPRPCGGLVLVAPVRSAPVDAAALVAPDSVAFLERAFGVVSSLSPSLRALPGALLATVTQMDGAFGLEGASHDAVLGGLSGLPKTAAHEWESARCRALDVSGFSTPQAAAAAIVDELGRSGLLETALLGSRRRTLRVEAEAARPTRVPLQQGDLVVVTGGARGVTAETAVALAREWRPALLLLGRSSVPHGEPAWLAGLDSEAERKKAILSHHFNGGPRPSPAELERVYREYAAAREVASTLARLREVGVSATYVSVDVRDAAAVAKAIADAEAQHGPVRGLVHAAGVLADKRLEDKTPEQFASVLRTKLDGLRHLLAACRPEALRVLALFSSVTARFGRPGQVDYCMANEALNKIADVLSHALGGCKVASMNWGPWDGGMVNDGLRREFTRLGVGLIPLASGARALVEELAEEGSAVEVLIGDGFPSPDAPAALHPALEIVMTADRFGFLASHRLAGRAVLPVAMVIEWMAHAALHAHPGLRFAGIDDLAVLKGVTLSDDETVTVRFMLSEPRSVGEGAVEVDVELRGGDAVHARGRVRLAPELPTAPEVSPRDGLASQPFPIEMSALYETRLFHGPHFHALRAIRGTSAHGLAADLASAPRPSKWMSEPLRSDWVADPLVLDGGLQMGLAWCFAQLGLPSLPTRVARYRQHVARFPKKGVQAWLEVSAQTSRSYSGELCFADAAGRVVARLEGVEWAADASLAPSFEQGRPQKTHR